MLLGISPLECMAGMTGTLWLVITAVSSPSATARAHFPGEPGLTDTGAVPPPVTDVAGPAPRGRVGVYATVTTALTAAYHRDAALAPGAGRLSLLTLACFAATVVLDLLRTPLGAVEIEWRPTAAGSTRSTASSWPSLAVVILLPRSRHAFEVGDGLSSCSGRSTGSPRPTSGSASPRTRRGRG